MVTYNVSAYYPNTEQDSSFTELGTTEDKDRVHKFIDKQMEHGAKVLVVIVED